MFVTGKPKVWLRIEGLFLFIATLIAFNQVRQHWWIYIALLFVPDIFMIGYVRSNKLGALLYNLGHSYPAPFSLLYFAWINHSKIWMAVGIIWIGHIGWDRFFGYGLKYDSKFKDTHLGSLEKGNK